MNIVVYVFIYYIIGVAVEFALMTIFCKGCIALESDDIGFLFGPFIIGYKDIIYISLIPFPFSIGAVIQDCYCCIKYKCNYEYQINRKRYNLL